MANVATKEEIHRLIHSAENPRDKAFLLIMLDIHDNLVENTNVTRDIKGKVESHSSLVARSRGLWQATTFFLLVLQSLFGYEYLRTLKHIESQADRISVLELKAQSNGVQIQYIQDRVNMLEGQNRGR